MPVLRAILADATLKSVDAARVVLVCPDARFALSAQARSKPIAELFERQLGRPVEVVIESAQPDPAPQLSPPDPDQPSEPASSSTRALSDAPISPVEDPINHPLVRTAIELLGARIVSVQRRAPVPPAPPETGA